MDSQKQQAAERVKQANNILVTVSNNPSVDQLAACIGVTVALNKMGKHATAVFSGAVPSTIEFLQPEKTLEKNTDSLRDFIIALDKSKADKLRYKVEDRVVKIFITPYKTSINEKDLEFSQGDFNVDVVLALGVHNQAELDQAITSHGRILHDATVITLNTRAGGELGSINWLDPGASSLSELGVQLLDLLDKKLMDTQIATALLTGIVAETDRFSNAKTSPQTMSLSAELMAAGANQQLVATKLEEPPTPPPAPTGPIANQDDSEHKEVPEEAPKPDDGTLEISHDDKPETSPAPEQVSPKPEEQPSEPAPQPEQEQRPEQKPEEQSKEQLPEPAPLPEPVVEELPPEPPAPQIHIDEHGSLSSLEDMLPPKPKEPPAIIHHNEAPKMVLEPPTLGGQLTATGTPGPFGEPNDGLGLPNLEDGPLPNGPSMGPTVIPPTMPDETPSGGAAPADSFIVGGLDAKPEPPREAVVPAMPDAGSKTLTDIEKEVHSPHVAEPVMPTPEIISPVATQPADAALPSLTPPSMPAPAADIPVVAPTTPIAQDQPAAAVPTPEAPSVDSARDAVMQAINGSSSQPLEPVQALNAQPVNLPLAGTDAPAQPQQPLVAPDSGLQQPAGSGPVIQPQFDAVQQNNAQPFGMPAFPGVTPQQTPQQGDPNAPPPVPPPMMPPTNPY